MVGHANLVGFYQLIPYLRHYPLRFASKVIENIPAFQHFSGRFKRTPQAHAVLGNIYPIQRKTLENETC